MAWIHVEDFRHPGGWVDTADGGARSRWYCEQLEAGQLLLFDDIPFELPEADRQFLLALRAADSRYHKNISYRPTQDALRGYPTDRAEEVQRLHGIMRDYSARVTEMLARFLAPYAGHWSLDYASFRPLEEEGRSLPLHKRNDLLHVDAFPSRPTHGGRILRVFTNLNPTRARVWLTAVPFDALAPRYANDAGLTRIAARATSTMRALGRQVAALRHAVGLGGVDRSPYDEFMLRFHDYLKENSAFQQESAPTRLEFPPNSTWVVFTDGVPHAALSGQFALEQTYIIPVGALLAPQHAPLRILEGLCGRSLS
jgi:3-deoxy-D-manno-oct-2-ulosonic acid (Kdo) hydroxylase